ncbi:uncharacterized protein EV422DRAFT_517162 [Fimicolochytrium jonesii]|uniref:uncharacterized protein n=1 Tax=Fimicolochytrium jonesii TaxID=1396493 RepID=UPI0022FE4CE3|nr:uncharacterized protein EV422DRAFT_517162 [Fimicolochytrium jonesii]KAI8825025.1 hypothetical protein EV422DRAFT_517162 [Fimicolochytrium jonesii]
MTRLHALACLLLAFISVVLGQETPVLSVRQLNFTGTTSGPSPLSFQVISTSKEGTYVLKWENLAVIDGCRLHLSVAHQSMGTFFHACPEDFKQDRYTNDSDTMYIYPTLPYAGIYTINARFTIFVPAAANITLQPSQTTLYVKVDQGDQAPPQLSLIDQRTLGQALGPNDSFIEPWVYQRQVASLPAPDHNPAQWPTNQTFRAVFGTTSGAITTNYCKLFTVLYYTTNSSAFDIPTNNFQKYLGRDAHILLVGTSGSTRNSQSSYGYRVSESQKWQPFCTVTQAPPPFELTSPKIGFGLYFPDPGTYNVFVQTKINGFLVTSSFPIKVQDPLDVAAGARKGVSDRNLMWGVVATVLVGLSFIPA